MDYPVVIIAVSVGLLSWFLSPVAKRFETSSIKFLRACGPGSLAMLVVGAVSFFAFDIDEGRAALMLAIAYLVGAGLRLQFDPSISPKDESTSL